MSKRKTTMGIIGNPGTNPMGAALAALILSGQGKAKRTEAEQKALNDARQARREEEIRQGKIIRNVCPDCSGKLIRGRKQKLNSYKRAWRCENCEKIHSM